MSGFDDVSDGYEDLASQHVSFGRVLALFEPYRWRIAGVVMLMVLTAAIGLAGPFLLRAVIDIALPQHDLTLLVWLVLAMVAGAMIAADSRRLAAYRLVNFVVMCLSLILIIFYRGSARSKPVQFGHSVT